LLHESCTQGELRSLAIRGGLTNSPQRHPEILVGIKLACKLITIIENAHEAKEVLRRYSIIYILVLKELMCRFDEQELQDAFDDYLLEYTSAVCQSQLSRNLVGLCFLIHGRERCRSHEIGGA
jgi:hypothetical protein